MKYLLDTNICIYIIEKNPPSVLEWFLLYEAGEVGLSMITVAELAYGVAKSSQVRQNSSALSKFLASFILLDFDFSATMKYGVIRSALEAKGTPIGPFDTMIASHALSLNCILVTNNEKEFQRVSGLKIENWVTP